MNVDGCFWTGFNSVELLSSTYRIVTISIATVDSSSPNFFINFSGIFCILENSAFQNVAYLCIDMSMDDMTGQVSTVEQHMQNYEH